MTRLQIQTSLEITDFTTQPPGNGMHDVLPHSLLPEAVTELSSHLLNFFSTVHVTLLSTRSSLTQFLNWEKLSMASDDKPLRVFCIGTADTKLDELRFLAESVRSHLNAFSNTSSLKVNPSLCVSNTILLT